MDFVRRSLSQKFVKPDEREVVRARIQQEGTYTLIDKVSVVLKEVDDKYWATLHNINQEYVHVDERLLREHDRLLMGGIWAEVTVRYDAQPEVQEPVSARSSSTSSSPSSCRRGASARSMEARSRFTRDEWIDLLMRSLGLEPSHPYFTPRRKLLYLAAPDPARGAQLQPDRARPARHRQELRLPADQPVLAPDLGRARRPSPRCSSTSRAGRRGSSRSGTPSPSTRRPASGSRTRTASTS